MLKYCYMSNKLLNFQIFCYMQITGKPHLKNEKVLYLHTFPLANKQACYHDPFNFNGRG